MPVFDMFNVLRDSHEMDLAPGNAVDVALGAAYLVNNPLFPDRKVSAPFLQAPGNLGAMGREEVPLQDDLIQSTYTLSRSDTTESEARRLAVGFGFKLPFASASAAYSTARSEIEQRTVMYLSIESRGRGVFFHGTPAWPSAPEEEANEDDAARRTLFLGAHGSHYVKQIVYGMRLWIRASIANKSESAAQQLSARLNACGLAWRVNAAIDAETRQFFQRADVEISSSFIGGGMTPPNASIVFGIDDIVALFRGIKDNSIGVSSGPLTISVESYRATLQAYPRCLRLFMPQEAGTPAVAPWGVPTGTIIAWRPSAEDLVRNPDTNAVVSIRVPEGWALCDGTHETPDLRDAALWGASDYMISADHGRTVGSNELPPDGAHSHGGHTGSLGPYLPGEINFQRGPGRQDQFSHGHGITADGQHSHGGDKRPKRGLVVFIMKIA